MNIATVANNESLPLDDIFSKPADNPIMMSITESKSFGSPSFDTNGIEEAGMPEITISLSSSSDSLGLNDKCDDLKMKASFGGDDTNGMTDSKKGEPSAPQSSCVSVNSSRTRESSSSSSRAPPSNPRAPYVPQSQVHPPPSYHGPPYHGNGRPNGVPPFHPHTGAPIPPPYHHQFYGPPTSHPSYDQRFGGSHHPPFHPGHMMQQHAYHQPPGNYPLNFPPYHPQGFYPPGPPPANASVSTSSTSGNGSSTGSVTSTGSKKRTISGMMESHTPPLNKQKDGPNYSSHRGDSNSSVSSNATSRENNGSDSINKLICESPLKRGRLSSRNEDYAESKRGRIKRTSSGSSTSSTLSFGGLSVNSYERKRDDVSDSKDYQQNINNITLKPSGSPLSKTREKGLTPTSNNLSHNSNGSGRRRGASTFQDLKRSISPSSLSNLASPSFDPSSDNQLFPGNDDLNLNRTLRGQSFTPIPGGLEKAAEKEKSNSPTFNPGHLDLAAQLSWSMSGDAQALGDLSDWDNQGKDSSPASFGGKLSPMFWGNKGNEMKESRISNKNEVDGRNQNQIDDNILSMGALSPDSIGDMDLMGGKTTPLPIFFDQRADESKSMVSDDTSNKEPSTKHNSRSTTVPEQGHNMSTPQILRRGPIPMASPHPYHQRALHAPTPITSGPQPMPPFDRRDDSYPRKSINSRRDGPPDYQSPRGIFRPPHVSSLDERDRVRNLRGRVQPHGPPPPPTLHLPPHMPSHHQFLTSPIGTSRMMAMGSPHHLAQRNFPHSPHMNASKRKCVPLKTPIPCKFQGDMEKMKVAQVPEFTNLVNFPAHMSQKQSMSLPEGMRCCVMCGHACPSSQGNKSKKAAKLKAECSGDALGLGANAPGSHTTPSGQYAIIPTQNKGLCTSCDVNVWVVTTTGLEIKWCKGCKNFRPWAAFGDKGLATKCLRCRDRQREKYALQKEQKIKKKALLMAK